MHAKVKKKFFAHKVCLFQLHNSFSNLEGSEPIGGCKQYKSRFPLASFREKNEV